jgi:MerR family transcriptional regulator, light-induced transcriptional regulator
LHRRHTALAIYRGWSVLVVAESALPEITGDDTDWDGGAPLYSPAWVAQRLGVTPATLRTWHHRYDLGPTGRTTGGHRRYSLLDLQRLDRMQHLTTSGIGVAEAARLSHQPPTTASHRPVLDHEPLPAHSAAPAAQLEPLMAAADDLDQACTGRIVAAALHAHGVVTTWTDLITPALRRAGERFARSADGIQSEHVLSESIRAALGDVVRRDRHWEPVPPVLIAAPDGEQHVLPLHALAAALAELNRPSVLLGASVPSAALVAAAARVAPAAIFLWSHDPATARRIDLTGGPTTTGRTRPPLLLGGPGWPHRLPRWADALVDDLRTALRACAGAPSST